MATSTISDILKALRSRNLLEGAALHDAETLAEQHGDIRRVLDELVRKQRLTPYQAEQVAAGRTEQLVMGAYLILEPIGKGGMGEVFRARQRVLERDCALKIIRKEKLNSAETVERFLREARVAAKLKHPNIVAIHDANVADGVHYLAMELLHGTTLTDLVKKSGPMRVGQAAKCIRQAALGLQHAFEQGLVHRDIKPQNLFLEKQSDEVKILDLGLARVRETTQDGETATGELTREGEVMGTPDYMAPEQAMDTRSADHRADIYSLGCTLYFLLSGKPPFPGGSLTEKLLAHQQKDPVALEKICTGLPSGLGNVIRKAMAKQPGDRYQTPAELANALAPFENIQDVLAKAPMPVNVTETITKERQETLPSRPEREIVKPSSGRMPVIVIAAIVAVVLCCPLSIVGFAVFGVSLFVLGDAGPINKHRAEPIMQFDEGPRAAFDGKPMEKPVPEPHPDFVMWEIKRFVGDSFCLSADGTRFVHGGNGKFFISDLESGGKLAPLPEGYQALGIVTGAPNRIVMTKLNTIGNVISIHDEKTGDEGKRFVIPEGKYHGFTPLANKSQAILANGAVMTVWNLDEGKPKGRIDKFDGTIEHYAISATGLFVVAGTSNSRFQLWSLPTGAVDKDLTGFAANRPSCSAISHDGRAVAAGIGKDVYVWNIDAPAKPTILSGRHTGDVTCLAFAPDAKRLVSGGSDWRVCYWEIDTGLVQEIRHDHVVRQVRILPDGRRVLSASSDNTVRLSRLPKVLPK